jgi:predicted phosphoribosyltransferase
MANHRESLNLRPLGKLFDIAELRDKTAVFVDRADAGERLARLIRSHRGAESDTRVFAIPAGGVPVGAVVAERLGVPLDVIVVSKITLPWNTEAGYGAVAFDETVRLNEALRARSGLTEAEVTEGVRLTMDKVKRRVTAFGAPQMAGSAAIVVDDGLASGFTMALAVDALRSGGARRIAVAVPTAHDRTAKSLIDNVDELYVANVRGGAWFAVADAYERWCDVTEEEARRLIVADRAGRKAR